jgi:hypothetical protein
MACLESYSFFDEANESDIAMARYLEPSPRPYASGKDAKHSMASGASPDVKNLRHEA